MGFINLNMLYIYIHILSLAFNANGSLWLINWMRRELEWPVTCEQRSWSDRGWMGKKACVMDRCSEEKEECGDGAGAAKGVNTEPVTCCLHWQVSLHSLIARPRRVKGYVSIWWHGAVYLPHFIVSVPIFIRPSILIAPLMVPLHSSHQP